MDSQKYSADSIFNLQELSSPFKLPTDEEVFITREAERLQQQEMKERAMHQRIWEKQTACTKSQLRRPKEQDFQVQPIEDVPIAQHFPTKQRTFITAALDIVNNRKKQPQRPPKSENIRDFVEQKKDMFLVEMSYRILKEEREKIKKRIESKERALKRSEEMLDADVKTFNDHKETNRQLTEQAVKKTNDEIVAKKEREAEIKHLEQRKAAINAEISRNEDYKEVLQKHLNFLDKLTPADWLEEKKKRQKAKYQRVRAEWVARQKHDDSIESFIGDNDSQISGGTHNSLQKNRLRALKQSNAELEARFDDLYERGKIDVFTEEDEAMFFTEPEELVTLLKEIEDNNLFLIELMQELEQQIENSKSEFEISKRKDEQKCEDLRRNKEYLSNQLEALNKNILAMERRIQAIEGKIDSQSAQFKLSSDIQSFYKSLGYDDDSAMQPLQMMSNIENEINELLRFLVFCKNNDPQLFKDLEDKREQVRRDTQRDNFNLAENEKNQRRIRQAQARAEGPRFQKLGKPLMDKVRFQREKKKKRVEEVKKSEEELIREFIEEYAQQSFFNFFCVGNQWSYKNVSQRPSPDHPFIFSARIPRHQTSRTGPSSRPGSGTRANSCSHP